MRAYCRKTAITNPRLALSSAEPSCNALAVGSIRMGCCDLSAAMPRCDLAAVRRSPSGSSTSSSARCRTMAVFWMRSFASSSQSERSAADRSSSRNAGLFGLICAISHAPTSTRLRSSSQRRWHDARYPLHCACAARQPSEALSLSGGTRFEKWNFCSRYPCAMSFWSLCSSTAASDGVRVMPNVCIALTIKSWSSEQRTSRSSSSTHLAATK